MNEPRRSRKAVHMAESDVDQTTSSEKREHIQSLERGLKVLLSFGAERPRMTLSEVAVAAELNRATARRLLLTLTRLRLVNTNGKLFWLAPSVLDLGVRYLSGLPWWHTAQPVIEALSKQIQEPCSISVLDGSDVVYVARATVNRLVATNIIVGSRYPAFCTAAGRAILSRLPDTDVEAFFAQHSTQKYTKHTVTEASKLREIIIASRRQGYAVSNQELEIGLCGIAVPIVHRTGVPAAALTASLQLIGAPPLKTIKRVLPLLLRSAHEIEERMQM